MNTFTGHLGVKTITIILLTAVLCLSFFSFGMTALIASGNFYNLSEEEARNDLFSNISSQMSSRVLNNAYHNYQLNGNGIDQTGHLHNTNFYYEIKDEQGATVLGSTPDFTPAFQSVETYQAGQLVWNGENDAQDHEEQTYTVYGYVDGRLDATDAYFWADWLLRHGHQQRYLWPWLAAGSAILAIGLFIFLMICAGRRRGSKEIQSRRFDRIFYELILGGFLLCLFTLIYLIGDSYRSGSISLQTPNMQLLIPLFSVLLVLGILLVILFFMSTAVRLKTHTFLNYSLIYRMLKLVWTVIKMVASGIIYLLRKLPFIWKVVLALLFLMILEHIILLSSYHYTEKVTLWIFGHMAVVAVVLFIAAGITTIRKGGQQLAAGHLDHKVETRFLTGDIRRHAEDLNSISNGMTLAVEEKMRSERFKTELITNVSHDIKTPLTSIINYVDLLKSEPLESEKAREYVEVIDRHSTRLKKLTEDLIEASKASTGVLNVDRSPCEIGVLLTQVTGEYAEKLAGCDLDLVATQPDHPVTVLADGRLLWRIIDNLLSNACKYGQPGTRVYVSLTVQNKQASIVVRNISRYPLNISGDELMERFVRGDRSRSTDGSGLGLSIARSLSELQGAEFAIDIDGDLFKATLTFPLFSDSSMQKSADARVYNAVE